MKPRDRLGPYEIVCAIGAGGMGEVYRAFDTRLDRPVAIKILPEVISSTPGFRERFAREARSVSAVDHPHICALYDVGTENGVDFLVMQYIEGETLAERIRRGPVPVSEALSIARQIALGLEAAHERGIVHRDIKPSNIKLTADGHVKILDFGIAKSLTAEPIGAELDETKLAKDLTQAGMIVGSAGYMSPEQTLGGVVDKRTDIWAFGCVLFEMLAGRRAFGGAGITDVLAEVVGRDPDWTALPTDLPLRVRDVVRRCLQKDPSRRTRDVADARLELEEAENEGGAPVAKPAQPYSWRSASFILPWSIAIAALLVAAVTLLTRKPERSSAVRFSAVTTFSGVETQPALSPDGRSVAFVSNRDGQWDVYVGLVAGGPVVRITNSPEFEARPRWSPDGARVLFARTNDRGLQDLWVVPALGGTARRLVMDAGQPAWSLDGKSIAYTSVGAIWVCDASGGNPRAVTRPEPPLAHNQPAFSRDGGRIAFVRRSDGPYGELAIVELGTGKLTRLTHDGALAWSPVWSPDDRFIYFTSSRGGAMNIWKIPAGGGSPEQITAGQGADMDIDLSADGTRLVYSTTRSNLNLAEISLEPATLGQRKWLTHDAARGELSPRYSPDGQRIAYFSNRAGAEREAIWTMDADGENAAKLVDDDYVNTFPRWTPDGQEIVYDAHLPTLEAPEGLRQVPSAGGAPHDLPIAPWRALWGDIMSDGQLLYEKSQDTGEVYDPRTGQRQAIANLPGNPVASRDGHTIAYAVRPGFGKPSDMGVWVGDAGGTRRQIFHGWVTWFAWAGPRDMLILQGKPDFKGVLWRVDLDGRQQVVLPAVPIFRREHEAVVSPLRFDVHPDGRRIVMEVLEFQEADIGVIDGLR